MAAPVAAPAAARASRSDEPAEPQAAARSSEAADGAGGTDAAAVRQPGPDRGTGGGRSAPLDGLAAAFAGNGRVIGTGRRGTWLASTSVLPTLAASAVR